MNRVARTAVGLLLIGAGAAATAWLSVAPYAVPGSEQGVLRLAWSGRPERIEKCRRLTDAELEGVPAHMRQRVKCEGRAATYRLVLTVDGAERYRDSLAGGGARSDRPLHVLRDVPLAPGRHTIDLSVMRIEPEEADGLGDDTPAPAGPDTAAGGGREGRERAERARSRREALPRMLSLGGDVLLAAGDVVLVSYDADARRLVLRQRSSR